MLAVSIVKLKEVNKNGAPVYTDPEFKIMIVSPFVAFEFAAEIVWNGSVIVPVPPAATEPFTYKILHLTIYNNKIEAFQKGCFFSSFILIIYQSKCTTTAKGLILG